MIKNTFNVNDPRRAVQPASGRPVGWLPSANEQLKRLQNEVAGIEARINDHLTYGEPAAAVGKKVFEPDSFTFMFDFKQDGISSIKSQFVLKDGVTYEIPILFQPPGVMNVRFMKVAITQRLFVPGSGPWQMPVTYGDYFLTTMAGAQTKKFAFPDNVLGDINGTWPMRRSSFMWNLVDTKSGAKYSDELLSEILLLPQGDMTLVAGAAPDFFPSDGMLEFDCPWLMERDAQLTFLFRPIMPVIQPTFDSGYTPYTFEDRENANTVRNSAITVQVEMHGTRYLTTQDALRHGARLGPDEVEDIKP